MTAAPIGDNVEPYSWVGLVSNQERGSQTGTATSSKQGRKANEYLDNLVHHPVDCMDQRFHSISRCRRADSLAARLCGDLADLAFCFGTKRGVR
jgi:hypothetical protein